MTSTRRHLCAVSLVLACGALAFLSITGCDANPGRDMMDAGAPPAVDAAMAASDTAAIAVSGERASDSAFVGCLDGVDGDDDLYQDCADSECADAPVCCVGSTSSQCCGAADVQLDVTLSDCAGTCGSVLATLFGAPSLTSGFAPSGADQDSGISFDMPLDPRAGAVEIHATISAPVSATRSLDVSSFGLVGSAEGSARVLPWAAVQVNAVTRSVGILVGESIVDSASFTGEGPIEYTLTVAADGSVTVLGGERPLTAVSPQAVGFVYPAIFGRTEGVGPGARLSTLSVSTSHCDAPAALAPRAIDLIDEVGAFVVGTAANPSLAVGSDGVRYLAFDAVLRADPARRGIFVAIEETPLTFVVRNPTAGERQPLFDTSEVEEYTDPDLALEDGTWVMYMAGEANNARTLFRSQSALPLGGYDAPVEMETSLSLGDLDSPARLSQNRLLARESDPMGTRIVALEIISIASGFSGDTLAEGICGVDDDCASPADRRTQFVVGERGGVSSFDADEVDAPSLVVAGGVYRLYYAGRRGTRWATGVVVSEDGAYWRRISETAGASDVVMGPNDELAPLGVRGASAAIDGSTVTLVFEAYRGTRSDLFVAEQFLP